MKDLNLSSRVLRQYLHVLAQHLEGAFSQTVHISLYAKTRQQFSPRSLLVFCCSKTQLLWNEKLYLLFIKRIGLSIDFFILLATRESSPATSASLALFSKTAMTAVGSIICRRKKFLYIFKNHFFTIALFCSCQTTHPSRAFFKASLTGVRLTPAFCAITRSERKLPGSNAIKYALLIRHKFALKSPVSIILVSHPFS